METASWVFTIIALVGTILNSQMNVAGFFIWVVSNLGFVTINALDGKYAQATLFLINTFFAIRGIYVWRKKGPESQTKLDNEKAKSNA